MWEKSRLFGLCLGSGFLNGITSRVPVCFLSLFGTFLVFRIEDLPIISFSPRVISDVWFGVSLVRGFVCSSEFYVVSLQNLG